MEGTWDGGLAPEQRKAGVSDSLASPELLITLLWQDVLSSPYLFALRFLLTLPTYCALISSSANVMRRAKLSGSITRELDHFAILPDLSQGCWDNFV